MGILSTIRTLLVSENYAVAEFGLDEIPFFLALLRACPDGARLGFDRSEPESFVDAFREWSHRAQPQEFEADFYTIDRRFVVLAERLAAAGELHLDHHLHILAPDGRLLCGGLDDFTIVTLADDIRERIAAACPPLDKAP